MKTMASNTVLTRTVLEQMETGVSSEHYGQTKMEHA